MPGNLLWVDWTTEDWANATFCPTCGLPMLLIEPDPGEDVGQMLCPYCEWKHDEDVLLKAALKKLYNAIARLAEEDTIDDNHAELILSAGAAFVQIKSLLKIKEY
jgi:hypothetical protein